MKTKNEVLDMLKLLERRSDQLAERIEKKPNDNTIILSKADIDGRLAALYWVMDLENVDDITSRDNNDQRKE